MRSRSLCLLLWCAALGLGSAKAAGNVDVTFVQPERYSDAGDVAAVRDRNLSIILQHLQRLGERYLASGQTLHVEVLNLDLAGEMRPTRTRGFVRVLNGRTDWPHVAVRYALKANGQVLRSGEESVADMNYLRHIPSYALPDGVLPYETRMLERWFRDRFAQAGIAAK